MLMEPVQTVGIAVRMGKEETLMLKVASFSLFLNLAQEAVLRWNVKI